MTRAPLALSRHDDPPPKRALLSLKSMGVMCVVLAASLWLNHWDRWREIAPPRKVESGWTYVGWVSCNGVPWTYRTVVRECWVATDGLVQVVEPPAGYRSANVRGRALVLNLAVALAVSIALALASERFVFSRWRRGREGEKADP